MLHEQDVRRTGRLPLLTFVAVLALAFLLRPAQAAHAQADNFCGSGQTPQFVLGFATLKDKVGAAMGEPVECEHYDGAGNAYQKTTTGLAFYYRATNTPIFTNNSRLWVWTPAGLIDGASAATDQPAIVLPLLAAHAAESDLVAILADRRLGTSPAALLDAFARATPYAPVVKAHLDSLLPQTQGLAKSAIEIALKGHADAVAAKGQAQSGPADQVAAHTEVALMNRMITLAGIKIALANLGAAPLAAAP